MPALVGSERTARATATAARAEPTPIPAPVTPSIPQVAVPVIRPGGAAPFGPPARTARSPPTARATIGWRRSGSLLEIARGALVRGQAAGALAALERHARQFPSGALAEEREGLLVQALVAARQYDRARERAARFNQRYPRSLFAPVVEQALASIPVTERPAGPKQETP